MKTWGYLADIGQFTSLGSPALLYSKLGPSFEYEQNWQAKTKQKKTNKTNKQKNKPNQTNKQTQNRGLNKTVWKWYRGKSK